MRRFSALAPIVFVAALVVYANLRDARAARALLALPPGVPGGPVTTREGLDRSIDMMRTRLSANRADAAAAVALAEALLRKARVTNDGKLAVEAERALEGVLAAEPMDYGARRMLGAVYLSQHRFAEAVRAAERARDMRPADAWNYGVVGDAYLELGELANAIDAFDEMMRRRPSAAAYARMSYALERQGQLERALRLMQMAADATTAHDPESQAWHYAHLGHLYSRMGRLDKARLEYQRALFTFPGHPYAVDGLARVRNAELGMRNSELTTSSSNSAFQQSPIER